jgi:hypothetical protein
MSRVPYALETNSRCRLSAVQVGLMFKALPVVTGTVVPPAAGTTSIRVGAWLPTNRPGPMNWTFPDTIAISRPSGDHASECGADNLAIVRKSPPSTGRAYTPSSVA